MGLAGFAEEAVKAIRESFNATGHPRDPLYHATGVGNGKDRACTTLPPRACWKRIVGGHFGVGGPELMRPHHGQQGRGLQPAPGRAGQIPAGGAAAGLLTKVGLETFVDPRIEGAKAETRRPPKTWSRCTWTARSGCIPQPAVDVALLRGSYADENGNVSMAREGVPVGVAVDRPGGAGQRRHRDRAGGAHRQERHPAPEGREDPGHPEWTTS